jgi:hypothetical protein
MNHTSKGLAALAAVTLGIGLTVGAGALTASATEEPTAPPTSSASPTPPPVEAPAAVPCVLSGATDTEHGDLAPVLTDAGLVFDGPTATGQGKDLYYRVSSGNAQGITHIGYTVAAGSVGFTAQINIEVNPHNSIGSYTSLAANTSGSGTFSHMETLPIWWATRIHTGPGSQAQMLTLGALIALMPNNTLYSGPSLHLQSQSPADAHSVVSSLTSSCGSFSYVTAATVPPVATPVTPVAPKGIHTGDSPVQTSGVLALLLLVISTGLGIVALRKGQTVK